MKIQWEYDFVERPFCEQLRTMGWDWIEGDVDVPELTERANFRDVFLKAPLATLERGDPRKIAPRERLTKILPLDSAVCLLDDWRKRNPDKTVRDAMDAFIRERCAEWAKIMTGRK